MANRNVSFYKDATKLLGGDSGKRDYDWRRLMAEQLMKAGGSTAPVGSTLEGVTRALSGVAGGYFAGEARREDKAKEEAGDNERSAMLKAFIAGVPGKKTYMSEEAAQGRAEEAVYQAADAQAPGDGDMYTTPRERYFRENAPEMQNVRFANMPDQDEFGRFDQAPNVTGMDALNNMTPKTRGGKNMLDTLMMSDWQRKQAIAAEQRALADKIAFKQAAGGVNSATGRPSASIQISNKYDEIVASHGQAAADVWLRRFGNTGTVDAGGKIVFRVDAANPNAPAGAPEVTRTPKPEQMPKFRAAVKTAEENATADAEIRKAYTEKGIKSQQALDALVGVEDLIKKSTGSWGGAAFNVISAVFGHAPEGAINVGKLRVLQANLMLSQPRMEGPQSDKDVQLYREAAGQIGDPTVPNPIKLAAVDTIRALHGKYVRAGGGGSVSSGSGNPAGVTDAVWAAMSPEDKALF